MDAAHSRCKRIVTPNERLSKVKFQPRRKIYARWMTHIIDVRELSRQIDAIRYRCERTKIIIEIGLEFDSQRTY